MGYVLSGEILHAQQHRAKSGAAHFAPLPGQASSSAKGEDALACEPARTADSTCTAPSPRLEKVELERFGCAIPRSIVRVGYCSSNPLDPSQMHHLLAARSIPWTDYLPPAAYARPTAYSKPLCRGGFAPLHTSSEIWRVPPAARTVHGNRERVQGLGRLLLLPGGVSSLLRLVLGILSIVSRRPCAPTSHRESWEGLRKRTPGEIRGPLWSQKST